MKRLTLAILGALLAALLLIGPASASAAEPTYLSSFGDPNEELLAKSVAVNEETGDVYVANYGLHTIERFSSSGQKLGELTGAGLPKENLEINELFTEVAVNNHPGPTKGWVYVVGAEGYEVGVITAFDSEGHAQWQVEPIVGAGHPLGVCGVAVDPSGALWVAGRFNFFSPSGMFEYNSETGAQLSGFVPASSPCQLASDGVGDLYEGSNGGTTYKYEPPLEESSTGTPFGNSEGVTEAIATNALTGDVYIDYGSRVSSYDSTGASLYPDFTPHEGSGFKGVAVDASREMIYAADSNNKVEVWSTSPNPPRPFALNLNGQGTVECKEEGGSFGSCVSSYGEGKTLTLKGFPATGYMMAGWLGCKQVSGEPNECTLKVGEASEVTAIFLREGSQGPQGQQGEPGQNGTNGSNGATGPQGAEGKQGPQGPQGPAGQVTVTCKVKQKGKKVKVTCTVKQGASASSAHWRLARHGRVYRRGLARHGRLELGALAPGHYRLYVQGQSGSTSIVIA